VLRLPRNDEEVTPALGRIYNFYGEILLLEAGGRASQQETVIRLLPPANTSSPHPQSAQDKLAGEFAQKEKRNKKQTATYSKEGRSLISKTLGLVATAPAPAVWLPPSVCLRCSRLPRGTRGTSSGCNANGKLFVRRASVKSDAGKFDQMAHSSSTVFTRGRCWFDG